MSELRREKKSTSYFESKYIPGLTLSKEHEMLSILFDEGADFRKRLYLVHFLKVCGYSLTDMMSVIEKYNRWKGYNRSKTENIIQRLVFNQRLDCSTHHSQTEQSKRSVFDLIDVFFNECEPVYMSVPPSVPSEASHFFHSMGFSTIPCMIGSKRPAVMRWKPYQDTQPSLQIMRKWNWDGGIIILGSHRYCFLDIDMKNDAHPKGFEDFDEKRLRGWCYEKTPGGGYHIFGKGNMKTDKTFRGTAEIISYGAYIKTYPSAGYIFHGND